MLKKQDGFTLIEMLIVLLIITVLILLIVPTMAKRTEYVHEKGCDALKKAVQAQVNAYQLEEGSLPASITVLAEKKYITEEQKTCQNGEKLALNDGIIK